MVRAFTVCFVVAGLGFAFAGAPAEEAATASPEIAALREKRISFLRRRVEALEATSQLGASTEHLVEARVDLLNTRIEYASDVQEKRVLLNKLLAEYETLVEIQKGLVRVPTAARRPGESAFQLKPPAASEVLRLEAERVRIQIAIAELN